MNAAVVSTIIGVVLAAIFGAIGWTIGRAITTQTTKIESLDSRMTQFNTTQAVMNEQLKGMDKNTTAINSLDRNMAVITNEFENHMDWHKDERHKSSP